MAIATMQFEAGAMIRRQVLFQLRAAAERAGLTFRVVADDGGWLSTSYLVRVEGPDEAVLLFQRSVKRWMQEIEAES